jgi:hypothetical protein
MGGPTALGQFRSGTTVHNVKSFYAFVLGLILEISTDVGKVDVQS